jgi:hypothetical protein
MLTCSAHMQVHFLIGSDIMQLDRYTNFIACDKSSGPIAIRYSVRQR